MANADKTRGTTVNCNIVDSAGASVGRAATSLPAATPEQPIQYASLQVYGVVTEGSLVASLVCILQPAATLVVEARLGALVVGTVYGSG